jgi:hypothetical protein
MPCKNGSQRAAYSGLVTAAGEKSGANKSAFNSAVDSFEPHFFDSQVVVLDSVLFIEAGQ